MSIFLQAHMPQSIQAAHTTFPRQTWALTSVRGPVLLRLLCSLCLVPTSPLKVTDSKTTLVVTLTGYKFGVPLFGTFNDNDWQNWPRRTSYLITKLIRTQLKRHIFSSAKCSSYCSSLIRWVAFGNEGIKK